MDIISIALNLIILLFSVIIHEISHGVVAGWFGDDTAKEAGRLTLNPISHLDPIMSITLPAILALTHSPVFGAAKPVPVNYNRMNNPRLGLAIVSLAGPLSNFILATIAGILIFAGLPSILPGSDLVLGAILLTNFLLGVFNFIPVPPLDGSRVLAAILPRDLREMFLNLDRLGFILVFILIYAGAITPIYQWAFKFLELIFNT